MFAGVEPEGAAHVPVMVGAGVEARAPGSTPERLRCAWMTRHNSMEGGALGYARANAAMRGAALQAGMTEDFSAPLLMHFCWPIDFFPEPGRCNVLFTMYETEQLHPLLPAAFERAQAIITPSAWGAEVFRRHTDKPVYTVPLGVHEDLFAGIDRPVSWPKRRNKRPFRWLFVGAHNLRKGFRELLEAWLRGFVQDPTCELYLKIADEPAPEELAGLDHLQKAMAGGAEVVRAGNVLWDRRVLTDLRLWQLYAEADAFIFPTMGEGFGLTLLEAMATALPCVTVLETAVREFADERVCLGLRWAPYQVSVRERGWPEHLEHACQADPRDIVVKMRWLMDNPVAAKQMGLRANRRAQDFSWAAAGQRLVAVLKDIDTRWSGEEGRR